MTAVTPHRTPHLPHLRPHLPSPRTWPGMLADLWRPVRASLGRDRPAVFPWVAIGLATSVLVTSVVVGSFTHEISNSLGNTLGTGWPTLRGGRWWTLLSSFVLTRNWFMAATMPVCLFAGLAVYERRAGHVRAFTVAFIGHVTCTVIVSLAFAPLALTGAHVLVRAADNVDYGGSMAIAAGIGALLAYVGDKRLTLVVVGLALAGTLAHHQMSDWGHVAALPAGYGFASIEHRHHALLAGGAVVGITILVVLALPGLVG